MSEATYYQRNMDVMLNMEKVYYKNDKERLRKQGTSTKNYLKKKKM